MKEFSLVYFVIYGFFAFFAILFALKVDVRQKQSTILGALLSIIFASIIIFVFGFRDYKIGTDTMMYKYQFLSYKKIDFGGEFMVTWLMGTIHSFSNDPRFYFLSLSLLYISILFWACYNFSKVFGYNVFFIFFSFVSFYFFLSLGINIARQGVALAFVLLAWSYYMKNPKRIFTWLIPVILAIGFHITSSVIILLFIVFSIFKKINLKVYIFSYFLFIVLAFFKVSILSLGVLGDALKGDRRNNYLDGSMSKEFEVGFKPQFVIFNTLFLVIFFLLRKYGQKQENYDILLKVYIGLSCIFFFMFQIPYSDRWGVMSWVFIPFLLAPVFGENGKYKTSVAAVLFLAVIFSIFQIMYYK